MRTAQTSDSGSVLAALESQADGAYDEETFRFLLGNERARAHRAARPLSLLLVAVSDGNGSSRVLEPAVACRVFDALRASVRETDIVGWYRAGHVAAAILTDRQGRAVALQRVVDRLGASLRRHVPTAIAERLRVEVVDDDLGSKSR